MKTSLRLAVAAAFTLTGTAYAVDHNLAATTSTPRTFAAELVADGDVINLSDTATAGVTQTPLDDTLQSALGFGVAAGQNRYLRYDFGNAKLAVALANTDLVDTTTATVGGNAGGSESGFGDATGAGVAPAAAGEGVTIVSGGAVDDSCVVFQVKGLSSGGNAQADVIKLDAPSFKITDAGAPITASYAIHETALSAGCATGTKDAQLSSTVTADVAKVANSVAYTGENGQVVTADVAFAFKQEIGGIVTSGGGSDDVKKLTLGTITSDIVHANLNPNDLAAVDQADLLTKAVLTVAGDFSAKGTVTLATDCDALAGKISDGVVNADNMSVVFDSSDAGSAGLLNGLFATGTGAEAKHRLCYDVTGDTEIPVEEYKLTTVLTAATSPDADLAAIGEQPIGKIIHNGTVLKAPFARGGFAGTGAFINLVNTGSAPATYTLECFSKNGTDSVAGTGGTVPANQSLKIFMGATGCVPSNGDNSVEIILDVPVGTVTGTFVSQNLSTGMTGFSDLTGNEVSK